MIPVSTLKSVITDLKKVIQTKPTVPILGHVFFNEAKVYATNLDAGLQYDFGVQNMPQFTVDPDDLLKWIQTLDKHSTVSFRAGPGEYDATATGVIDGKTATRRFMTFKFEDSPPLRDPSVFGKEQAMDLENNDIARAILSSSTDESRYFLNGVALCSHEKKIPRTWFFVSTDGRRAFVSPPRTFLWLPESTKHDDQSIIIPLATCELLCMKSFSGPWLVSFNKDVRVIQIRTGAWTLQSKLVDGNYPNYRQVLPKDEYPYRWVLSGAHEAAVAATRIHSLPRSDTCNSVKISISKSEIVAIGDTPESGKAEVPLPGGIGSTKKEPFLGAFNPDFLLDALAQGIVDFRFKDEVSPCWGLAEDGAIFVCMPVRL